MRGVEKMANTRKYYDKDFKEMILSEHINKGKSLSSLAKEYNINISTISKWKTRTTTTSTISDDFDFKKEYLKLQKELNEIKKEKEFLKKAAAFFAKEI